MLIEPYGREQQWTTAINTDHTYVHHSALLSDSKTRLFF
jgi:hypothetical protein